MDLSFSEMLFRRQATYTWANRLPNSLLLLLFEAVAKEPHPIILVEQNAQMALNLAHRGYVIETGRIVIEGNVKDLLHNKHVKEAFLGG